MVPASHPSAQDNPNPEGPHPDDSGATQFWVRAYKDGDRSAFESLYTHLAPTIFAWSSMRIRPSLRGQVDPGDVVQEVFLRALKGFANFDPEGPSIRAWLFRIAKNVLLEAGRAGQKHRVAGAGSNTRFLQLKGVPDSITAISVRLARDENMAAFNKAIEALKDEERALVIHCGLEGMLHAEVAERLGLNSETVTKRWQRLRKKLIAQGLPTILITETN
jgi:RNA polymerase sigma-70 factor (ECF subfamily)